jgi:sugar lactone lactonase YvrE
MFKFSRLCLTVLTLTILAVTNLKAFAAGPMFWEVSKQEDILKGDARGISISENGTMSLAPSYTLFYDTKEAYVWSTATDAAGNIYLGTGHDGKIFKVEPSGTGRMLYDATELDVTALTTDAKGTLYAATSPEGKIYKITSDGTATVFFDPPYKYIWSLLYDNTSSTLYAGTGDKGVILKIDAAGKETVLADTTETNIVALALDKSGNLIAGTDPSGLVLRISSNGKTFALLDTPAQEIHNLSVAADGSIYLLGVNQQGASQKTTSVGTSSTTSLSGEGVIRISTSDEEGSASVQSDASGSAGTSARSSGGKSSIYRILPDGGNETLWSSGDTFGFAMKLSTGGNILVGTGTKGRIYAIGSDRSQTLLIQSPEEQTSAIFSVGDTLYAASSNLGRLYRIGNQTVSEGTYISTVRDTKFAGQWGAINWRGAGSVQIQTRTGNTETPDLTWSDWSAPYSKMDGEQISSPRARFIQWKATLKSSAGPTRNASNGGAPSQGARLEAVTVAYLPRNQAPEIASINVLPPGVALQELPTGVDPSILSSGLDPQLFGLSTNLPPRRFFQKGARTVTWSSSDANGDSLIYTLFYKTLGDNSWHLLADNLTQNYYTIDGNRLADGTYYFKVVASDSPENPEDVALKNERSTDTIEIDNTSPAIKAGAPSASGSTVEVSFDVTEATSRIIKGEYSIDGGQWRLLSPVDGIADSAKESFKVRVTFDKPGEHVIAFRCADSSSNVATSKVTVTR